MTRTSKKQSEYCMTVLQDNQEGGNENVSDMAEVQALIDCIAAQDTARNYPNFGDDCEDELISEHISVYSNYDGLLEEMGLEEERI